MLKSLVCKSSLSLLEVMKCINANSLGIVFCVDEENRFQGTLSDGDIRRAILAGVPLEKPAFKLIDHESESFQKILNSCENPSMLEALKKDPVYAIEGAKVEELMKLTSERVSIIPILNSEKEVIDFFEYKAHFNIPIATSILSGEEISNVLECLETNWISSQGKFVRQFELLCAEYIGTKYALSCSNGTAALTLALLAVGVGHGDEVIVPDLTFGASANAVLMTGATPVLVDVDIKTWCISVEQISLAINDKTKAIMPVHLYGFPCEMKQIMDICAEKKIYCVEDVAEAFGASYGDKKLGSISDIGCFSFFGNKIITTGEGGMVTTNDDVLFERMVKIRDHGMSKEKKYWHDTIGFNFRMTNMQAAVGCGQINRVKEILDYRKKIHQCYESKLSSHDLFTAQEECPYGETVVWLVSYLLDSSVDRDKFIDKLKIFNIDVRPFFYALSSMPFFEVYAFGDCKNSREIGSRGVNLPTLINLTEDDYKFITDKIFEVIAELK